MNDVGYRFKINDHNLIFKPKKNFSKNNPCSKGAFAIMRLKFRILD